MPALSLRSILTAALIAAVAPVGLAVLDLEQPASAKNGNDHGGGNGGGNGHGHDNGGGHGNSGGSDNAAGHNKTTDVAADADATADATEPNLADDPSLSPHALGKLNGVLHASPQAIANASPNSPIGAARIFGKELSDFLDAPDADETPSDADATSEDQTDDDQVTVEDLGKLMADMTNKPVTAAQVQAVVDRLAADDPANEALQDVDPDLAQDIADEANAIHGFTDETADAGEDTGGTTETVN